MTEPITMQTLRDFYVKLLGDKRSEPPPFTCGPLHPDFVDRMRKEKLRCPDCGHKARKHK